LAKPGVYEDLGEWGVKYAIRIPANDRAIRDPDPSPGQPPEKGPTMSRSAYPLKLPHSAKKTAQRLAKEDRVSLNKWIAVAVAEKVGVVETAAEFSKKRAGKAKGDKLMKFLF
jgi:hypothetical protein